MLSPIEKLIKFLKLEKDRNFDNRAVVGGLEKIIPGWQKEARSAGIDTQLIQLICDSIAKYPALSLDARSSSITTLLDQLSGFAPEIQTQSKNHFDKNLPHPKRDVVPNSSQARYKNAENISEKQTQKRNLSEINEKYSIHDPVTVIPGIGPAKEKLLHEIGIKNIQDLLYYFPKRYIDYSNLKPINRIEYGENLTIIGTVKSINTRNVRDGKMKITEAIISDGSGSLRLNWFNNPWIEKSISKHSQIVISGTVEMYLGRFVLNSPTWEPIDREHLNTLRIVPIYPLTANLTQKDLRDFSKSALSICKSNVEDFLPENIKKQADVTDLATAIQELHFPSGFDSLKLARNRIAFDEIFLLQLGVQQQKLEWQSNPAEVFEVSNDWLMDQIKTLPYQLTSAQNGAITAIRNDLASGKPMNRLLQGDVGSGKTVVAAMAISMVIERNCQTALLAPTSILAEQHYRSLINFFQNTINNPVSANEIRLLLGDTPEDEKQQIRDGLENGQIKVIVGTHSLIQDKINFKNLQLAVIDEQHRFGVDQRKALRNKGTNPHLLVMTATPIPRSLSLTLYGDLDITIIDELPVGRQPVETHIIHPLNRERAYHLVRTQIEKGYQAFIIYPLVEKGDNDDGLAAVEEQKKLQNDIFPELNIGLLHGRMKPEEKDETMMKFRNKEFDILVSTSVIEVGVDIPNATVMLIEAANRFGLAQLHQFRGRVGRGSEKSYCLLIPENENGLENERLSVMKETNDGFALAEKDLEQRGPGDFLGARQSGYAKLNIASFSDIKLIEKARALAANLFENDPDLSQPVNSALRQKLNEFWSDPIGDIS